LIAAKQERFVCDDRSAKGAAELIALQRIAPCRKKVPGVHLAVAEEFERTAVELVCAGLHDCVDRPGRVHAAHSRERARLYLELLQSVGKREWKIRRVVRIVVRYAIEKIS